MTKLFSTPFAEFGDRREIEDGVQFDGTVSFSQGWGPDYQRPRNDPNYKPVDRYAMNQVLYDATNAIRDLQFQGFPTWSPDAASYGGYPMGGVVRHLARNWQSLIDNNTMEPPATGMEPPVWRELAASEVPNATRVVRGITRFATAFEVEQGVATDVAVSPADVKKMVGDTGFDRIIAPTNIAPANGALGVELSATLQGSAYMPMYSADPRLHRRFQVALAGASGWDDLLVDATVDADNLVVDPPLSPSAEYKWRQRDVSQAGFESAWSRESTFSTGSRSIVTPSIVLPVAGAQDVPEQPIIKVSAFSVQGGTDTAVGARFRVKNSSGTVVHTSPLITFGDMTEYALPAGVLQQGGLEYFAEAQWEGSTLGASAWSQPSRFFTSESFVPSEPGAPFGGGYFVAAYMHPRKGRCALVDMGIAAEINGVQWKTANTSTSGTDSTIDGEANTQAMTATQALRTAHPAATQIVDMRIGGYSDIHMPAELETELLYRYLKPTSQDNSTSYGANQYAIPPTNNYTASNPGQTGIASYRAGGVNAYETDRYYWTSTQNSTLNARSRNFTNGNLNYFNKTLTNRRARGVRSVSI